MRNSLATSFVRLAVLILPRPDRQRYAQEFDAELVDLPPGRQRTAYATRLLLHAGALRWALIARSAPGTRKRRAVMRHDKPMRCRLHMHHMVWFSTADGGRWRHCSRCGTDWGGGRPMGWTYDMARRGEMGF